MDSVLGVVGIIAVAVMLAIILLNIFEDDD